jgi:recombination protein RecA
MALDRALGVGGIPKGRVIEIFGPESSGKTTLALQIIANAQKAGGKAAFIDAEHALDPEYAEALGVDIDELLVSQPDNGEQALEIADILVKSGQLDVCVIDSVAALVPRVELEGEMGQSHVGLQARLMSQAMRKLTGYLSHTGTACIFINQIREKVGGMATYGPNETTAGGRALKFFASVRIDIRRIGSVKEGDNFIANKTKAKVVKNKLAAPFRISEFEIVFGKGIVHENELLDFAVDLRVAKKAGSWFTFEDIQLGQGKPKAIQFLIDHPDIFQKLESQVMEKLAEKDEAEKPKKTGDEPDKAPDVPESKAKSKTKKSEDLESSSEEDIKIDLSV